jgi:osmotically-inducible protein OsmY
VILEGEVFDEEVKQLAAQRVRKIDGVKKVINALHISDMVAGAEPRHSDAP